MRCYIGKYIFVSISAFLLLVPCLSAQSPISEEPYWHFLFGGSYTLIGRASDDGNPRESVDNRPNVCPVLGLGYRHPFPRSGSGELRLTYSSQKGSFRTASGGRLFGQRNRFDLVTNWLNLSYLFSYQTKGPSAFRFEFGPNLGFLLNGGEEVEIWVTQFSFQSQADNRSFQFIEDNRSLWTSTMFGLQAGLVVVFPFTESLLGNLSLSYQFAGNNRGSAFFLGESMQVHAFMLTLGVQTDL